MISSSSNVSNDSCSCSTNDSGSSGSIICSGILAFTATVAKRFIESTFTTLIVNIPFLIFGINAFHFYDNTLL